MQINTKTKLAAIIGYPLEHSLSPAIHNAAARYHKLNAVFVALPTKNPKAAIAAMRALNIVAFSVTIPYKEKVMPYLDEIDKSAQELGNVNTIINKAGKLKGYNTDIDGVRASMRGIRLNLQNVIILGAGGAAKTIAYVIAKAGARIHIVNRDLKQARVLAKKYKAKAYNAKEISQVIENTNPKLIVNATPVGMGALKDKSLVPASSLKKEIIVFDVIYNPTKTKLLKSAESVGCKIINGKLMFLSQGARQFKLWSKKEAPIKVVERAFNKALRIYAQEKK